MNRWLISSSARAASMNVRRDLVVGSGGNHSGCDPFDHRICTLIPPDSIGLLECEPARHCFRRSFSLPLAPSSALLLLMVPLPRVCDAAALATVDPVVKFVWKPARCAVG
jgi:hypothetical protein